MSVYFIGLLLSLLFCLLSIKINNKRAKLFFQILSFVPFVLIAGLRSYNVGIDTSINYVKNYNIAYNYGTNMGFAGFFKYFSNVYSLGYSIILYILSRFFSSPTVILLFCSLITFMLTYFSIYKNSANPLLSIIILFFCGYFMLTMNGMRGFLALSIIFYSIRFIKEKKLALFLLFAILATSIHTTMLVFLILYPLYHTKMSKYKMIMVIFFIPFILSFGNSFLSFVLSNTAYQNYFIGTTNRVNPVITMLFINIFYFILYLLNYKKQSSNDDFNFYFSLQLLSVVVCFSTFVIPDGYRIEQFFDFFHILSVPYLINISKVNLNNKNVFGFIIILIVLAYFTKVFVLTDDNQVKDYSFINSIGVKE